MKEVDVPCSEGDKEHEIRWLITYKLSQTQLYISKYTLSFLRINKN